MLVRHAHAGDKQHWKRDDHLRPLSEMGWQQAHGLAENVLSLMGQGRLMASPFLRSQQTLQPLATRGGRAIESVDLLAPDVPVASLQHYLDDAASETTTFCTHGEVLNGLLARWVEEGTQLLADGRPVDGSRTEKGGAWLVLHEDARVVHYIRPLHVGPPLERPSSQRSSVPMR